jgi:hypothetical protein
MLDTEHPMMGFHCPMTQEHITLTFGYLSNEPMMPIYKGEDLVAMIPRDVLIAALKEGWGGTESGWWVDPGKN